MSTTTSIDKNELKQNIINVNNSLDQLASELKNLNDYLNTMMGNGGSGEPYWNGERASKFYKNAIINFKDNIADYKAEYNKLNDIAVKYETLVKNDN